MNAKRAQEVLCAGRPPHEAFQHVQLVTTAPKLQNAAAIPIPRRLVPRVFRKGCLEETCGKHVGTCVCRAR